MLSSRSPSSRDIKLQFVHQGYELTMHTLHLLVIFRCAVINKVKNHSLNQSKHKFESTNSSDLSSKPLSPSKQLGQLFNTTGHVKYNAHS